MKGPYRALGQAGAGVDKLLGDLEREVMEVMWAHGPANVRDVLDALNEQRPTDRSLAYTTVMTVMSRLADKGVLRRKLVGKAHAYEAEAREAFVARASREMARRMVDDFGDAAIASFLAVLDDVDPERLARLRAHAGHGAP